MVNQPLAKTIVISPSQSKPVISQQILRGQRGATDIIAVAPLELNSNDELRIGSFTFTQTTNLAVWVINHNLGKPCPFVTIKDEFGETIIGDIRCIDDNNLEIRFNQPTTGTAYLI